MACIPGRVRVVAGLAAQGAGVPSQHRALDLTLLPPQSVTPERKYLFELEKLSQNRVCVP